MTWWQRRARGRVAWTALKPAAQHAHEPPRQANKAVRSQTRAVEVLFECNTAHITARGAPVAVWGLPVLSRRATYAHLRRVHVVTHFSAPLSCRPLAVALSVLAARARGATVGRAATHLGCASCRRCRRPACPTAAGQRRPQRPCSGACSAPASGGARAAGHPASRHRCPLAAGAAAWSAGRCAAIDAARACHRRLLWRSGWTHTRMRRARRSSPGERQRPAASLRASGRVNGQQKPTHPAPTR